MKPFTVLFLVCATHIAGVFSYFHFQKQIPNGNRVPNPCGNDTWGGVGHQNMAGGGVRNPFGQDFETNHEEWTVALCQMDSDGDGRTNGQELGDPDCTWKVNSVPKTTENLSHPGICEPMNSDVCKAKNTWLQSCPLISDCSAFKLPGTKSLELRVPRTRVPAQETTYMCIGFELPRDKKYHIVGDKAIIDNVEVMHHMILFGCSAPLDDPKRLTEPWQCKMAQQNCQTMISIWGPGADDTCYDKEFGMPMGVNSFQYAVLQLHWNNPQLKADHYDNSGLKMYYTEELRQYDGAILMVGQNYLELPPWQAEITYEGTCKQTCTNKLTRDINIVGSILHMHLQGKSGDISILRKGQEPQVINVDTDYDYNAPTILNYEKHIPFKAGDEIKVKCVYQTLNKNITTHFGEGTQDEMCFGFLHYYPYEPSFDTCSQWDDLSICSLDFGQTFRDAKCDIDAVYAIVFDPSLTKVCNARCSKICSCLLDTLISTNCFDLTTAVGRLVRRFVGPAVPGFDQLYTLMNRCLGSQATCPPLWPAQPNDCKCD